MIDKNINIECKDCKYINWNEIQYSEFCPGYVRFGCYADNVEGKTPWIYIQDNKPNSVVCSDFVKVDD